jgi:class 3 adenylate cyclase
MHPALLRWAYDRFGARYPRLAMALLFQVSHLVVLGGVWLLDLYVVLDRPTFWRIMVITQAAVLLENLAALTIVFRLMRPADPWLNGDHSEARALEAWRALAALPLEFVRWGRALPFVLYVVPISIYLDLELEGSVRLGTLLILAAGASIVLLYGLFLRFFAGELLLRPVLADISRDLPDGADLGRVSVPLRWKLLIALPAINVVSGVVIAGLAAPGDAGLDQMGIGVLVTLAVSGTISLELSLLLLRSILEPITDLRRGTDRVATGDLDARVPVLGSDETGTLASSFNQMVSGLAERAQLREALGAYVDPGVADQVLQHGSAIPGEEVKVTVVFLDIRGFTAFAERTGAREAVARLNAFYALIVPVIAEHGGHANKFVGDGLLAVFGAPDHQSDHADRAVAAALDIVDCVARSYGDELRVGIGINSGTVVAGTVGGGGRLEFTVIGDPVNTAARVERATRTTGDDILLTEATRRLLRADHGGFITRGETELRGRAQRVLLHAPARTASARAVPRLQAI